MRCNVMRRVAQPAGARGSHAGASQVQQGAQVASGSERRQEAEGREARREEGEASARKGRRARWQAGQSRQAAEACCQEVSRFESLSVE